MCDGIISNLAPTILLAYFFMIPLVYIISWSDSGTNHPFIRWYFIKSDSVNILGYLLVLIIGSGSFIWALMWYILILIFYVVALPLLWLFEFIFLDKDCSHLRSEELIIKEYKREYGKYLKRLPQPQDDGEEIMSLKTYIMMKEMEKIDD